MKYVILTMSLFLGACAHQQAKEYCEQNFFSDNYSSVEECYADQGPRNESRPETEDQKKSPNPIALLLKGLADGANTGAENISRQQQRRPISCYTYGSYTNCY